jgi:hypothetical protein
MSLRMKDSESLKNYSARYWEVYNEVDGGTEDMAITAFKQGLDPESELRHSLSKRPAKNMRDLMSRIQQYVRVEEDRARTRITSAQSRPLRKIANTEQKRAELPPRNPTCFPRPKELGRVYTVFNKPIYRIMGEIKNEPFFLWPAPLGGDPAKRDPNKYCSYHREKGHMTVITPFLPPGFSRVSARKTRQPKPSWPDPTSAHHVRITSRRGSGAHFQKFDQG